MTYSDFLINIAEKVASHLQSLGFRQTDNDHFVLQRIGHEINVIAFQKHTSEPKVCVNMGVHYDFIPKLGTDEITGWEQIEIMDCEIKTRLTPNSSLNDYWWSLEDGSLEEIANLIFEHSPQFFRQFDLTNEIVSIDADDLNKKVPALLQPLTIVRACLLLARIHQFRGDMDRAARFATIGVENAGMAVGPKRALKELLISATKSSR